MSNPILEAALAYAADGWRVLPLHSAPEGTCTCAKVDCASPGKHPKTAHGVKDATTDPETIHGWFDVPGANLGVATGHESGLLVLDIDDQDSADGLQALHGDIPEDAKAVRTGRDGFHVYYAHPGGEIGNTASKLAKGIDTRGDGGYVVAPPSVHANGRTYEWVDGGTEIYEAPAWMFARRAPKTDGTILTGIVEDEEAWEELLEEAWERLRDHGPATEGQGGDAHTLNACSIVACDYRLTEAECKALLLDWNTTCVPPWDESDLWTKLRNAVTYRPAVGIHRLWHKAGHSKWGKRYRASTRSYSASSSSTSEGKVFEDAVRVARIDLAKVGLGSSGQQVRTRWGSIATSFEKTFPAVSWVVRGVLRDRALYAIAAEPKSTKTWNAAEMALAVATGTNAFGEFSVTKQGPVAYFFAEDEERDVRNRFRALAAGRGLDAISATQNIYARYREAMKLESDEDLAFLVADCRCLPTPPVLVILDPMRDIHDQEENSNTAMKPIMDRLRALRTVLGCAVIFVHHSGKSSLETAGRRAGQKMRGGGIIHGAVDGGLYIYDMKTDKESWWETNVEVELKGARGAGEFSLKLEVEDNMDREAVKATWTYTREQRTSETAEAERTEKHVDAVKTKIRMLWLESRGQVTVLAEKTIRGMCGLGIHKVREVLKHLETFGRIRHTVKSRGDGAGWEYIPDEADQRLLTGAAPPESAASRFLHKSEGEK